MPISNNVVGLIGLDFDSNKNDLRNFLLNQQELAEYNYQGSTLQVLLNLLAFNTYKTSFYTNMVANEMFLDSAQLRSSVVSRAKELGYVPKSAISPTATIEIEIFPQDNPATITIARNTQFSTVIDGFVYTFINTEPKTFTRSADLRYVTQLDITEGIFLTHRFLVSSQTPTRYVIPNENIDQTRLTVDVQTGDSPTSQTRWVLSTSAASITKNSPVYYVFENEDGKSQ